MSRPASPRKFRNHFVTDAGGRRKVLCHVSEGLSKAKSELIKYLAELEQEKEHNLPRMRNRYTVHDCAADFVECKSHTKSQRTYKGYIGSLNRLVAWYGNLDVRLICLEHGIDYLRKLSEGKLGNVSINHHMQAAKAVFNHAVKSGWIHINPWNALSKLPEIGRQRVITDEEFQRLLAACDVYSKKGNLLQEENCALMKDILWMLRLTALRPGELRILRWDHLRPENNLIVIPASEHKTGTTTKNPKPRIVPYLEDVQAILDRRRAKYGSNRWVFTTLEGNQWQDDVLARRFARLRSRAGLDMPDPHTRERLCLYSLRHTRLTEVGTKEKWSPYLISAYAGHSIAMTQRYIHPDVEAVERELRDGRERRQGA